MRPHTVSRTRGTGFLATVAVGLVAGTIMMALALYISAGSIAAPAANPAQPTGTTTTATTATTPLAPTPDTTGDEGGVAATTLSNVDFGMRLKSATVELVNINDDEEEFLRLRFTRDIQELDDTASAFAVQGYDPDAMVEATSVVRDEDDADTLIVGFPAGTDLQAYTVATVEMGVVEDIEDNANIADARTMDGGLGARRRTSAPELLSASTDASLDRIEYTLDEFLDDAASADAGRVGYYTRDGEKHLATSIESVHNGKIVAQFDAGEGDQVEEAVRLFMEGGAVGDRQDTENLAGVIGARTVAPDLVSVRRDGGSRTQWIYTFDEAVADPDESLFHLYTRDGTAYDGESSTRDGSRSVQVTFPDVRKFAKQVRWAAVDDGAVNALQDEDQMSTVGAVSVGGANRADITSGPDLDRARLNRSTGIVTYRFDEPIDEDASIDASGFMLVTDSGTIVEGEDVVDIDEPSGTLKIQFPTANVETAVGALIEEGSVMDLEGNGNITDALRVGGGGNIAPTLARTPRINLEGRIGGPGCTRTDEGCE